MSLLDVRDVTIRFGGVTALADVSFSVEPGEIFAIVGPNGAGKSTLFNLISRFCEPESGDVRLDGASLLDRAPADMAPLGVARTFQNIDLFETSTVLENLLIGRHTRRQSSFVAQAVFSPAVRRQEIAHREAVERIIDFLDLHAYREQRIAGLPYGTRKVVEVGRALAMEPRIVLLDEPASGLSPEESRDMRFWISDIRAELGVTGPGGTGQGRPAPGCQQGLGRGGLRHQGSGGKASLVQRRRLETPGSGVGDIGRARGRRPYDGFPCGKGSPLRLLPP